MALDNRQEPSSTVSFLLAASDERVRVMQAITFLGLALCLGVLYQRARQARKQPPRTVKQRFKTAHVLLAALLAWLVVSFNLQHLDHALSGEQQAPQSTWERVVRTLSDWVN